MQYNSTQSTVLIILLWSVLIAISGWVRPLYYSSEEMHYASIAWEMWQHNHFILPIQSGLPYAEKGPLLFWLIHLGWKLFGVSTWWLRLLPELFGLATLLLLPKFILQLWPSTEKNSDENLIANSAPIMLLGSFFFAAKIPMMRFDIIVTFLVLLSLYFLILSINNKKYLILFSVSMALGLLTKGPIIFLFVLPAAMTVKWWAKSDDSWTTVYLSIMGAVLLGILLTCGWLIPAIHQGGSNYTAALLFTRSIGRIWQVNSYLQQEWFYYFFVLTMMLLPWIIWLPFWRSLLAFYHDSKRQKINSGLRFLFIITGSTFVFLTFVAQKGPRYFLPALPFIIVVITYILIKYQSQVKRKHQFCIAIGYLIAGLIYALLPKLTMLKMLAKHPWLQDISPLWGCCLMLVGLFWLLWRSANFSRIMTGLTISTILFWSCFNLGITKSQAKFSDWRSLAQQVHQMQLDSIPVSYAGSDQVLEFFGQLRQPLEPLFNKKSVKKEVLKTWAQQHPDGWIVIRSYKISPMQFELVPSSHYYKKETI